MSLFARTMYGVVNRWAARSGLRAAETEDESEEGRERRRVGVRGELLAYWFLRREGYTIVRRNFRTLNHHGEIDLIGWDGDVLAFVEVKTRATSTGNVPEAAVDAAKRDVLRQMARRYLARRKLHDVSYRFDVVAIEARRGQSPVIRLHRGAFHD